MGKKDYFEKNENAEELSFENFMKKNGHKIKRTVKIILFVIAALVLAGNSCSIVQQRERGIEYFFGKVKGDVIQPGIKFHIPFVSTVKKYSISPRTFETTFFVGNDGAITKDMQTVGTTVNVKYAYDENRIMDIAKRYGDSVVSSAMQSNIIASVKEVVGQYSIYELVEKQPEVTSKVAESMLSRMKDYPISISQTTITNWNWSEDFDRQIKETANRTQQVRQAEQEANIAAANAQKLVKEAEAKKQAAQLDSEAQLIKAQNEAQAKKAEADGIAYYNAKVAQNMNVQQQQWKHEEQMAYYEKWDGSLVPQYVPLTAAGGIVNLPAAKQ
ncbi:prohibitin family protein [Treponema sp. UBA753]|uniref:prohibitin family protein n=1 Tax=Treponema sp. UBA753 TaxID=1947747 RepID=UPI0025ED53B8|nr:prohibitin family protein [Treponema sp. UBA753]